MMYLWAILKHTSSIFASHFGGIAWHGETCRHSWVFCRSLRQRSCGRYHPKNNTSLLILSVFVMTMSTQEMLEGCSLEFVCFVSMHHVVSWPTKEQCTSNMGPWIQPACSFSWCTSSWTSAREIVSICSPGQWKSSPALFAFFFSIPSACEEKSFWGCPERGKIFKIAVITNS